MASGKIVIFFSPFLLLMQLKILNVTNKPKSTLKRWREEAAQLATSGPKEQQGDEFQVSFCLIHPRLGGEKINNPEMPGLCP